MFLDLLSKNNLIQTRLWFEFKRWAFLVGTDEALWFDWVLVVCIDVDFCWFDGNSRCIAGVEADLAVKNRFCKAWYDNLNKNYNFKKIMINYTPMRWKQTPHGYQIL